MLNTHAKLFTASCFNGIVLKQVHFTQYQVQEITKTLHPLVVGIRKLTLSAQRGAD